MQLQRSMTVFCTTKSHFPHTNEKNRYCQTTIKHRQENSQQEQKNMLGVRRQPLRLCRKAKHTSGCCIKSMLDPYSDVSNKYLT